MAQVAVIIPTYNRARLIGYTIDSVLAQTFDDFELVVVDDGSTDDTSTVVAGYGNRVRYLWQPNSGNPASARNRGVEATSSEYLAFVDSDDLWQPEKLSLQVDYLDKHPECDLVFGDATFIDEEGKPLDAPSIYKLARFSGKATLPELLGRNFIPNPTPLLRRSTLDRVGGYDSSLYHADYDLWLRIAANGVVDRLPKVIALIRHGSDRMSSNRIAMLRGDVTVYQRFAVDSSSAAQALRKDILRRLVRAHVDLAVALHNQGDRRSATSELWAALKLNPVSGRAYWRLGLLMLSGKRVMALSQVKQGRLV